MGGGLDIPHWQAKNCTVGPHTPELQNIERRLAARGLKDPWLRNEAWRYARVPKGYDPKFMVWSFVRPRAMVVGFGLALLTSTIQKQYFDKKWKADNAHLYHDHH